MEETIQPVQPVKKSRGLLILVVVLAVLVVLLGGLVAYGFYKANKDVKKSSSLQTSTPIAGLATTTAQASKIEDQGVTWIDPVKLDDLNLFSKNGDFQDLGEYQKTDYYKVGSMSDGRNVVVAVVRGALQNHTYRFFLESGKYSEIVQNSDSKGDDNSYNEGDFTKDSVFQFKSLVPDKEIIKSQTKLSYNFNGGITKEDGYSDPTKIVETKWGNLFLEAGKEVEGSEGIAKAARYYIKLNDSTRAYYDVKPTFLRDDGTLDINWSDSSKNNIAYSKIATGGCGGGQATFPYISDASALDGKEQVASDAKVYFISSKEKALVKFGYAVYKMGAFSNPKSIDEFVNNLGVVTWVDDYGNPVVFINNAFKPEIECGKPVVYLYPEKPTQVQVKVAADITKSEPEYKNGWNVLANPDGKLQLDGKTFPYLFWEGLGKGVYPQIDFGSVVAKSDVVNKIETDLKSMNLNDKEIADFLDFWTPKMPDQPFVRLSWLTNKELDRLAPISVTPKPDSIIRVFLDFVGLDKKIDLKPQQLPQFERKGFSVVEWGGLLKQ
ncbi:MAG: hypothetical protein NTZ65_02340 [Candidatus Berkelbacteria bacterium]|nr:hypothetical protein [Candidatus Berkelbacteria bacterium]